MLINKELTIKLLEELKAQFSEIAQFTEDHEFVLEGDFGCINDTISFQRCNVVYNIDCFFDLNAYDDPQLIPYENSKIAVVKFAVLNNDVNYMNLNIWEIFNTYMTDKNNKIISEYYDQLIFDLSVPRHLELYNKFIIEALRFIDN